MEIPVTQAHMDAGKKGSGLACPIALAIREAGLSGGATPRWIRIGHEVYHCTYPLADWIRRFDQGGSTRPFILRVTRFRMAGMEEA